MSDQDGIHTNGFWLDEFRGIANVDESFCLGMAKIVSGRVMDLGCGGGQFVGILRAVDVEAYGVDGNPNTPHFGEHLQCMDLTQRIIFPVPYDWVLCLEVGEHIPEEFEATVLENITRNATQGVIISWAVPGQKGRGHINCRSLDYIKAQITERGFHYDDEATQDLKRCATVWWYRNNSLVFRRI